MKNKQRLFLKTITIIFIVIILFVVFFFEYSILLSKSVTEEAEREMSLRSKQSVYAVNMKINDTFILLKTSAKTIASFDEINAPGALAILRAITKDNDFTRMAVTTKDGTSYTDDGAIHNSADRDYFIKAMAGENTISQVAKSRVDNSNFVAFAVPIYKNNEIIGVLRTTYQLEMLKSLVDIDSINDDGEVQIITADGTVITSSEENGSLSNFNDILKESKISSIYSLPKFENDLINNKSNLIGYTYKNQDLYAYYEPVGKSDWYVLSICPVKTIISHSNRITKLTIILLLEIFLVIVFLIWHLYIMKRKSDEELRINQERYKIIVEQSNDIIFDYNIKDKSIYFSNNFVHKMGYEPILNDVPKSFVKNGAIFDSDIQTFNDFFERIISGEQSNEASFRIRTGLNKYIWFKTFAITIYDEYFVPLRAVGKIVDINKQKHETELLHEQIRRDPLTTLYNKLATKNMIETYLHTDGKDKTNAMFFIDIDNFKSINDNLGHSFGDKAISEISDNIKKLFRASDIVGRVGGDEFIVFLKNASSIQLIIDKANEVSDLFRNTYADDELEYKISGSIGISLYPDDATDYNGLFKKSDLALYSAKKKGKDRFEFYDHTLEQ